MYKITTNEIIHKTIELDSSDNIQKINYEYKTYFTDDILSSDNSNIIAFYDVYLKCVVKLYTNNILSICGDEM